MHLSDFTYQLPEELIALHPTARRSGSRLLALDIATGALRHERFTDLPAFLRPGDLLVFNNTRVIPARLYGHKPSGGAIEVLIERVMEGNRVLCQIRSSKSPKPDSSVLFPRKAAGEPAFEARVMGRKDAFFVLRFAPELDLDEVLAEIGHIPLPPYIKREDELADQERYQTVYAQEKGAVAAPTAGLHFDTELLAILQAAGVEFAFLTLHVGAGTFQPVRVENILEHKMHTEQVVVSDAVCEQVNACKSRGGRVIAVGTTSVRSLESAGKEGRLHPFHGETGIFIYPGYQFQIVDAMITNFHLPESTLLLLVSAFATKEMLLDAYEKAIEQRYRFFSYGDAMLLYSS